MHARGGTLCANDGGCSRPFVPAGVASTPVLGWRCQVQMLKLFVIVCKRCGAGCCAISGEAERLRVRLCDA